MRAVWLAIGALAAMEPAGAASYREVQTIMAGPWRAVAAPAKTQKLGQDQARCRLIAMQTPVTSNTPAVIETIQWAAEINCMNALGYESAGQSSPRK